MKLDIIFLVVIGICVIFYFCSNNNMEHFNTNNDAKAAVNAVYQADVGAIRTLADVATKLQQGSLTIPGAVTISSNMNTNGVIFTNGKTNLPTGWGGGLRTWDIYGSGSIGWGGEDAKPLTLIRNDGSASFASNNFTIDTNGNLTSPTISDLYNKINALTQKLNAINPSGTDIVANTITIGPQQVKLSSVFNSINVFGTTFQWNSLKFNSGGNDSFLPLDRNSNITTS
jgi:hypothetical protein